MLSSHLTLGARRTFVGGKGGVGKTTVAAALAVELTDAGERVLVLSLDPAHSLGDALDVQLGPEVRAVAGTLDALEVDAAYEQARFMERHGAALSTLLERGTYLDAEDVGLVGDLTVPGIDELAGLLRLTELANGYPGRIVVDTAPTGHTGRLLELPRVALGWLAALEAMEEKHGAVAAALTGWGIHDEATAFLERLRADVERLSRSFADPVATRFVLVTTTEPAVVAETLRFRKRLRANSIGIGGLVVNRHFGTEGASIAEPDLLYVPLHSKPLVGIEGLRRFSATATPVIDARHRDRRALSESRVSVGDRFAPPLDRRLYLVTGKGGVGKSTAAAALAVRIAASGGRRVLLLSVDPAGSLAEILDESGEPEGGHGPGVTALEVRQLDAEAAWSDFRSRYREEVEDLFDGLLSGGLSTAYDQRVVEGLIDLAPPGLDELVALLEVIDLTEDRKYDALVLDTAPTGHLLRLLELPGVALEWSHAMMRLLLKYREVVHLGGLGEEVLRLAKRVRALQARLRDASSTWVLVVALPESLSVPETDRLVGGLRSLGVAPGALLVNRALDQGGAVRPSAVDDTVALAVLDPGIPAVAAAEMTTPTGSERLLGFIESWRRIEPSADARHLRRVEKV